MRVVMLSKGRRPGAYRQGRERDLARPLALRFMAEGKAAVVVPAGSAAASPEEAPVSLASALIDARPLDLRSVGPGKAAGGHVFIHRRALLSLEPELPGGRRRLRVFEADSEWTLADEDAFLVDFLLELGCACRALPRPGPRDTLVRMIREVDVAGVVMGAGQVAALDFDPLSVLPELRGLGLFPWEVLEIEADESDAVPRGAELDRVRLVVRLDDPWLHPGAGSFLSGVHVDMSYGDYRLHPPVGEVRRAYAVRGRSHPPFAVLGP